MDVVLVKNILLMLVLLGFSMPSFALEDGEMAVIISDDIGLSPQEVQMVLESFKSQIISTLQDDGEIKLNGVGKFFLQQAKANQRKDHRTGEMIDIPAKNYLRFRASYEANENFNPLPSQSGELAPDSKTTIEVEVEVEINDQEVQTKELMPASELVIEIPTE